MKLALSFLLALFYNSSIHAQTGKPQYLVISRITIVDVETGKLVPDQTVIIDGEKIVSVGHYSSVSIPKGSIVKNGKGKYLIPGLWDSHVHLSYVGASTLPVLVAYGITSVRDLGSILPEVHQWRSRIEAGTIIGPRIKAAGYNIESGKWLDAANQIINASDLLKSYQLFTIAPRLRIDHASDAQLAVDSLARMGSDVVKFRNLGGENFLSLAKASRQRGIPLVGHAPKELTLAAASDAGLASIEHGETIFNTLSGTDSLTKKEQFLQLAHNGTMLTPTLIADYNTKLATGAAMLEAINDSTGRINKKNRFISPRLRKMWQLAYDTRGLDNNTDWSSLLEASDQVLALAHRHGVQMLAGTDLGVVLVYPGSGLHDELALMVEKMSMQPAEALRAATLNPARFFRMDSLLGSVKAGKYADLVILNADPFDNIRNTQRINAVIHNGKYYNRQRLNILLKKAAADIPKEH